MGDSRMAKTYHGIESSTRTSSISKTQGYCLSETHKGGASDILQVPPKLSSTGLGLKLLRKNIHNILEKSDWTPTNKHLPNIYSSATQRFGLGHLLHMWMSESCETLQRPMLRPFLLFYNDSDLLINWRNKYNFPTSHYSTWRRGNWQNIHYTMGDWMDELAAEETDGAGLT